MENSLYPAFSILLVDDEPAWLRSLAVTLERCAGITNIITCQDSREVLATLARKKVGLILLDLTMPNIGGEELLQRISESSPEIAVIIISGLNQVDAAVRCVKQGAFDYFVKTVEEERLIGGVMRAIKMLELERESREVASRFFSRQLLHPEAFSSIVTNDRAMLSIFTYIEAVATSPQPLLITGESGVGKELFARSAHALSGCTGQLVAVNVAGLDDMVFSDTLFGHQRGAFTGADQPRRGMIEEAQDGTLFLDEIGDLSIASQVKLLRLLQEGEYFPLGSDRPKRLKARIIVATHRDLAAKVSSGEFRRDLFYRLKIHHLNIPSLRERKDDIPILLDHFLAESARSLGKRKPTPPPELAQLLLTYDFPGNVRELKAMVYNAVSVHRDRKLSTETFVAAMGQAAAPKLERSSEVDGIFAALDRLPTFSEIAELLVVEAMKRASNNQTIAARLLGISQPALSKRMKGLK